jgi:pimeloyl-ACP methyl ester carboxylesterase
MSVTPLHKPAAQAPFLALHSSGSGGRQWAAYPALLSASTHLVTPDLIGYTDAPWPTDRAVTLEGEAERLLPLLRQHGRPVHLVGHSYGGAVALQTALLWPEHVLSLTVYEPVLFHLLYEDPASELLATQITTVGRRIGQLALSGRTEESAALFVGYWSGDGVWPRMPKHRQAGVVSRMGKVRAEFEALFDSRMDPKQLAGWDIPVRIVRGTRSPASALRAAELLAARLPAAELVTVEGAGHMGPIESPAVLAPLLFAGAGMPGVTHGGLLAA